VSELEEKKILPLDAYGTRVGIKYLNKHLFSKNKGIISLDNIPKK